MPDDPEIAHLRDRIEELESILGARTKHRRLTGISEIQWRLLGVLMKRQGVVSREVAFQVVYGDRQESDQPGMRMIDTHICRINKRLAKFGVRIQNEAGTGYYMKPKIRRILGKFFA
jgi:DNA-binding response OmpR family regulator